MAPDAQPPSPKLFQNNLPNTGNTNAWIKIKLVGTYANRSGIGAKLRVKATIRGKEVWQLRQMVGGTSLGNTSTLEAHFGLGDAQVIDELVIEWPGQFTRRCCTMAVNQMLKVSGRRAGRCCARGWPARRTGDCAHRQRRGDVCAGGADRFADVDDGGGCRFLPVVRR